jgi:phosphate-selective porin OprO and OprP
MKAISLWVTALSSFILSTLPVCAQNDVSRLDRLEEAVRQLQQENASLKRELQTLRTPAAQTAATPATNTLSSILSSTNRTPFVLPLGKEAKLKLGGFIQGNGEFGDPGSVDGNFSDNTLTPTRAVTKDRIRLRRVRINVSGEFFEDFDFKLEGEFEQGDGLSSGRTGFSGTDLFANWHRFPEAQIKVGQWKAPFGLEQTTSDTALFTAERSLVTSALTQDRQLGIAVWGKPLSHLASKEYAGAVDYSFGIFNGNGRNTTINDDDTFMYAGRVSVTALKTELLNQPVTMRLAANGYTARFAGGTRVSAAGNLRLNQVDGALTAFTPTADSRAKAWGVDQWLTVGPFDLIAEYLEGHYEPRDNASFISFTANGYYVQPSYFLPFMGGRKFQLVARWESFNPDQAASDDIHSLTAGLNYYINGDALKLMFNYVRTWSDFRENRPGTGEHEFDLLLARFQLMF